MIWRLGAILLDGDEISKIGRDPNPIRRRIGIVFQSFNLFPHMSVQRNITLALTQVLSKPADEANEIAKSLLNRFGLVEKINSYPDRLSGGQQQRVAIVRALAMNPEVLLLDEITSALDPELVGEVLDVMVQLAQEGMTMMCVTHETGFARKVSNRVVFMNEGRIVEDCGTEAFFGQPQQRHERAQTFLSKILQY